jgi:hypothetical protein
MTDFTFVGAAAYTAPAGDVADFSFEQGDITNVTVNGVLPGLTVFARVKTPEVIAPVELAFNQPPATNGDLVFELLKFENQPVGADGQLSFVFWDKNQGDPNLVFGNPDGFARLNYVSVAATLPALQRYIEPPAEFVGVEVSGTLPLPTLQAVLAPRVDIEVLVELPTLTLAASKRPSVPLSVTGTLPLLTLAATKRPSTPLSVSGTLPMMTMAAEALYQTNTSRPTVGKTEAPHQVASKLQTGSGQPQQDAVSAPVGWETFWARVTGGQVGVEHRLPDVLRKSPVSREAPFQAGTRVSDEILYLHQNATREHRQKNGVFQNATKTRDDTLFKHQDGTRIKPDIESSYQNATPIRLVWGTDFQDATALIKAWASGFQDGVPPPAGISIYLPPVDPPLPVCYTPSGDLVFSQPLSSSLNLLFVCDGFTPPEPQPGPVIVPVKRVYIVINNVNLRRVSDNAVVPTLSMSLSLDVSSWTWGFDASLPMQSQAMVEPTTGPVELQASINGTNFRVMVENISRERSFGQSSIRISGRGRNAVLDAPYAPITTYTNTIERTANQLVEDALTYNNVPLGWSVEWGLTDWLVPANTFVHQGTHISAINAIAQAAGGYLQPHRVNQTLRILPKYPVAPWNWSTVTADFVLPADVTTRESIQWVDKPNYNRVFVSGQQVGVLGQVTRQGTAGDVLAPMVTDPLITHADAARQRGIAVLGDTGRTATVGISLPVLAETGIIEPGKFVEYVDGATTRLGIVRSTQVTVGASAVDTRQQLTLETHE